MKDKPTPAPEIPSGDLPKTGDAIPWWVFVVAAGVLGGGTVALAGVRHFRKEETSDEAGEEK